MKNEYLNKMIEFFMEHIDNDDRISLIKKMKYGFRQYHLCLSIDENTTTQNNNQTHYHFRESLEINFDNRNKCIEIVSYTEDSLIIEDVELLEKWCEVFEEYINKNIENKIKHTFEESLMKCYNKSLHREYQMKKIL